MIETIDLKKAHKIIDTKLEEPYYKDILQKGSISFFKEIDKYPEIFSIPEVACFFEHQFAFKNKHAAKKQLNSNEKLIKYGQNYIVSEIRSIPSKKYLIEHTQQDLKNDNIYKIYCHNIFYQLFMLEQEVKKFIKQENIKSNFNTNIASVENKLLKAIVFCHDNLKLYKANKQLNNQYKQLVEDYEQAVQALAQKINNIKTLSSQQSLLIRLYKLDHGFSCINHYFDAVLELQEEPIEQ